MDDESPFDPVIGGKSPDRHADRLIAELAARQHGVVARGQLLGLGFGSRAIDHRVKVGRLHAIHRGVYAVGHRLCSMEAGWMAAVLAGGRGAVLSHRSAAALWGLRSTSVTVPDVTVARKRSRPGIRFHRANLPADEVLRRGIPVTTVPRTLLDLASVLDRRQLERVVNEAEVRRLTDPLSLDDLLARHPRRHGAATIRAILASGRIGATVTRSELENRFVTFVDRSCLPQPEINVALFVDGRWIECDCVWRGERLVVELDGQAFHLTQPAFERDRARDRALHAAGWRVVRITWRQLHEEPDAIAADLRHILR